MDDVGQPREDSWETVNYSSPLPPARPVSFYKSFQTAFPLPADLQAQVQLQKSLLTTIDQEKAPTSNVQLVCVEHIDMHPPQWLQEVPHVAVAVDDMVYHPAIVLSQDDKVSDIVWAWSSTDGLPITTAAQLGTTRLNHHQLCIAGQALLRAFGTAPPIVAAFLLCAILMCAKHLRERACGLLALYQLLCVSAQGCVWRHISRRRASSDSAV
jgi:hypothetical protein